MHNKAEVNYTFDPPCTFIISKIVPGSILYVMFISTLPILNTLVLKGRYYAQVSLSSENHSRCQRAHHEEITNAAETDTNEPPSTSLVRLRRETFPLTRLLGNIVIRQ